MKIRTSQKQAKQVQDQCNKLKKIATVLDFFVVVFFLQIILLLVFRFLFYSFPLPFAVAMLFSDQFYLYNHYNGNNSSFRLAECRLFLSHERKKNVLNFFLYCYGVKKWARKVDIYLHQPIMSDLHVYIIKLSFLCLFVLLYQKKWARKEDNNLH